MDKIIRNLSLLKNNGLITWKISKRMNIIYITVTETKRCKKTKKVNDRNINGYRVHIIELKFLTSTYSHYLSISSWNDEQKQMSELQIINILNNAVNKNKRNGK